VPLLRYFAAYLQKDRALTQATLMNYVPFAQLFLARQAAVGRGRPNQFRPDDIAAFVLRHARRLSPGRVKLMGTALRSFFRFLRLRGEITTDLAACVPTVPDWRLTELPKSLPQDDVERVLKSLDPGSPAGLRDRAILLLLARLGLRATEIVHLELEDLDWEAGQVVVRGKGSHQNRLPLSHEVGQALTTYLLRSRPQQSPTRRVFLQAYPPYSGFAGSMTVSSVVRRALFRAGLRPARTGAHLFRHAVACRMLNRGATLVEIAQVLRHRHPDTTAVYAKVDVARLRTLAQPWPGAQP
jgi:site-specific recombinase XerD